MSSFNFCKKSLALSFGMALLAGTASCADNSPPTASRPNVLLIVVDDLGYSDIGAFGGEIDTPHLDTLIGKGRQLTSMYVAPTCSPTRAMLMSGTDHHLAGLGNMAEMITPTLTPEQVDAPGYEGYLNDHIVPLPELMQAAGYRTLMAGKWHLGAADGRRPQQRGFDRSWALMGGGAANFKQSAPMSISSSAPPPTYRDDDTIITLPDDFYSSRTFTDKMIEYLDQVKHEDIPFFAYLAYTAPHLPLQAPDKLLEKYRGRYDQGYEHTAAARLSKLKQLGLVTSDTAQVPMPDGVKPWSSLTENQRTYSARTMEAYAAMVEALDHEIGHLLDHLNANGQLDNTLIVFLSDNGPEGNAWDQDEDNIDWIPEHFDLSIDNIGRPNSFAFQGPAWGQVSAVPFRHFKAFTHEGGIRSAAFVVMPGKIASGRGEEMVTVMDVMPTILDLAGIKHPGLVYRDHNVMPMKGMSMLPWLEGRAERVHNPDLPLGFELMGRNALRKGDWKIVYHHRDGKATWALYNIGNDPAELHNLADTHAEKLDELLIEWAQYVQHNNVIVTGRDTAYPRRDY